MSRLNNLRSSMSGVEIPPVEISKVELELSSLVIAHAVLNPCFPNLLWGHIWDPATVLDLHGRVLVWYLPGIMPSQIVVWLYSTLEHLNQIHLLLKGSLVKEAKNKNQANKRFGHRHVPEVDPAIGDAIFGHGRLMTVHCNFPAGSYDIAYAEEFWNSIAEVTLPDLTCVGKQAIAAKDDLDRTISRTTTPWPSIYVGIDVIVNQETPPHLDTISAPSLLDLVASFSTTQCPSGRRYLMCQKPTKTRRGKLIYKEVDASHLYLPSGSQPSTPRTPRTGIFSQNLDIPGFSNSEWNDVEDAPQSQRLTKSQNDFIREWLPWRTEYLNVILEEEQLAKGGICPENPNLEESGYESGEGPPHYSSVAFAQGGPMITHPARRSSRSQMTIVHTKGIFTHEISWCSCPGSDPNDWHLELLQGRLFPASISKPKTAFTFDVLNHFLVDALECKTSAMSFYQKLKWLTNNAFPDRTGEVDMTAQHMKMNKPELDVALSDGKGYMVSEGPYQSHLQQSLDSKERSTCSNHREINAANINKSNLQSTGIGATAYFQKGEWYMNTDYSICNALGYCSEGITKSLVIYDVGCQWSVNFHQQVKSSPSLLLPPVLEIIPAVGKFHLAAHKLSCFPRYSLNFIKGAGHLDGEILETLWAPFNKISPTARSMSQAHRQEVYDDHMRDSNWKKLVGIVPSLLKKHKMANKCLEEMNQAHEQLTAVLDPDKVAQWELDALRAEADRGEALDIYLLKGDKAPTFHEVQLKLTKHPKAPSGNLGSVAWLAEGISIEDSQDQLRSELQQLPRPMSTRQEVKASQKRQRLSARIETFHSNGQAFFKTLEIDGTFIPQDDPAFCGKEDDEDEDWEFWHDDEGDLEAPEEDSEELASELMSIWMPSSIGAAKLMELGLHGLLKEERELRIGQANDCLDQLRTDLGNKAMEGTRSKKEIQKVVARVNKHVRSYQRARQAILQLDPDVNIEERYQEIQPEDLAVSKEVTEENKFGQGTSKLAWFWMMDGDERQLNVEAGGLMAEFYQINWLKARARRDRWKEEVLLVRHEMLWTSLWFKHHKNIWEKRALQSTKPGKEAYANKQIGLWSDFDKKARLMFQGQYKEARGNSELQNEILAEVKSEILQQAAPGSVALPNNLRVAIRRVFLPELDPEDRDDEENIILHILSVSEKRKEDAGEGEHVREERARPTKAGDYRKPFTAFTCGQRLFKDDLDLYDRERRDTKDPKTIGQRTKIVQKWWESL
ncbi:hypothetical protein EDC04DRAFT_2607677 [Pisolithus marmoratus]|nr:hypothetical protein EDC04DRAFT_2607677 [Pisolithus marmoratus]